MVPFHLSANQTIMKNELLAEIIKQYQPNPNVLLNIVNTYSIQPDWPNLPLPRGQ